MAFLLSPQVLVVEKDLTNIIPAVATTGGAYVGAFEWGPVMEPMLIASQDIETATFGKPNQDTFVDFWTAANFLAYGNNLQIIRVVGSAAKNAVTSGSAVLIKNQSDYESNYADGQGSVGAWAAKYPGILGNSITVVAVDQCSDLSTYNTQQYTTGNYFKDIFTRPTTSDWVSNHTGLSTAADEMHVIVVDSGGLWTGTKGTVLESFGFMSKASDAKNGDGTSNYYKDVMNSRSKYIWWMDHLKTDQSGIDSTTITGAGSGYVSGGPTPDTINFVHGSTGSGATGYLVVKGGITGAVIANAGDGYSDGTVVVTITGDGDGNATAHATTTDGEITAIVIDTPGANYTTATATITDGVHGGFGAAVTLEITGVVDHIVITNEGADYDTATVHFNNQNGSAATATAHVSTFGQPSNHTADLGSKTNDIVSTNLFKLISPSVPNEGQFAVLTGGVSDESGVTDGERELGWDTFVNTDVYDISLIPTGGASTNLAEYIIDNIALVRRDCVVFISPLLSDVLNNVGSEAESIVATRDVLASTSYAVMDSGWKYQYDKYNDVFRWIPLNADTAGLCAFTDLVADPWFSPAGFNRGNIKNVVKLAFSPNQTERDVLYINGVNPVVTFPANGTVLFGDKTMQGKPSAFDRINVRRLFIVLEKAIATAAKYQLFEFNDEFTRAMFRNMVSPFLRDVQGRRGLTDFQVVCDETNNTPDIIDSNQFIGDIYLKPTRSINFITLNFIATPTGVAFSEVGA